MTTKVMLQPTNITVQIYKKYNYIRESELCRNIMLAFVEAY
jgi:hypothetical protein